MKCKYCEDLCIKRGKYKGVQKYFCKNCRKYQREHYTKPRINAGKVDLIKRLNNEGLGISSISRLLNISKSSVQRIIIQIANSIKKPFHLERNQSYEIDELRTYVGNKHKECWVIYAINKETGKVIDLVVGRRTTKSIYNK